MAAKGQGRAVPREPRAAAAEPEPSPPQWRVRRGAAVANEPRGQASHLHQRTRQPAQGQARKPSRPSRLTAGAGVWGCGAGRGRRPTQAGAEMEALARGYMGAAGEPDLGHASWFPHTEPRQSVTSEVAGTSRQVISFIEWHTSIFWAPFGFLYLSLMKNINYQHLSKTSEVVQNKIFKRPHPWPISAPAEIVHKIPIYFSTKSARKVGNQFDLTIWFETKFLVLVSRVGCYGSNN